MPIARGGGRSRQDAAFRAARYLLSAGLEVAVTDSRPSRRELAAA